MMNVLYWAGVVVGAIGILIVLLLGVVLILRELDEMKMKRLPMKNAGHHQKVSALYAVRIPCKTHYYTVIAYIVSRHDSGKCPVVTILEPTLFRKLPIHTPVFAIGKSTKVYPNVTCVAHIKDMLRNYMQDIKTYNK